MPSAAAPFRLTREESGGGFPAKFYDRTYPRFTMALGGEAFLKVPLIDDPIRLAGGYLLYHYPGYVAFGGDVGFDFFGIVELHGRADGEFNAAQRALQPRRERARLHPGHRLRGGDRAGLQPRRRRLRQPQASARTSVSAAASRSRRSA